MEQVIFKQLTSMSKRIAQVLTKRWTLKEAQEFLASIQPFLNSHGFQGEIVGSVKTAGQSDKDLDISLKPTPEAEANDNFDIEAVVENPAWKVTEYENNFEWFWAVLPNGKLVDFWTIGPGDYGYDLYYEKPE